MTIGNLCFEVVESQNLDVAAISAVARGEIIAVRFPNWCFEQTRSHVLTKIASNPGVAYDVEPGFKKIVGGSVYDAADKPEKLDEYLNSVPRWFAELRNVFGPYKSPMEQLLLELQQRWAPGCDLQKFKQRPAFAGLLRALEDGGEARPHQDMTRWDIPDVVEAHSFITQLSAVCYLSCAEIGGLLQLWGFGFDNKLEYDLHRVPGDYGIDRKFIGEPAVVLKPRPGEMIVFNAQKIHAVTQTLCGKRSSQSTFVAFRGENKNLSIFS